MRLSLLLALVVLTAFLGARAEADYIYRHHAEGVKAIPETCDLPWGGRLSNGDSSLAYEAQSVPHNENCVSETRVCSKGKLSGSFAEEYCVVDEPPACGSEGQTGMDCVNSTRTVNVANGVQTQHWDGTEWITVSVACDADYISSGWSCVPEPTTYWSGPVVVHEYIHFGGKGKACSTNPPVGACVVGSECYIDPPTVAYLRLKKKSNIILASASDTGISSWSPQLAVPSRYYSVYTCKAR